MHLHCNRVRSLEATAYDVENILKATKCATSPSLVHVLDPVLDYAIDEASHPSHTFEIASLCDDFVLGDLVD